MPTLLKAAVLGVIQGLFEFLPVSSTAHLLLAARALGYDDPGGVFTVMIQLGSILAVVWLYRAKLAAVLAGLPSQPGARRFVLMVGLATVPLLAAGALFSSFVKSVLYGSIIIIAISFIVGGIVMLIVERLRPPSTVHEVDRTSAAQALAIGVGQVLALIPGVSRSGSTMVVGMVAGLDRPTAAEFSFFVAIPVLLSATAYELWKERAAIAQFDPVPLTIACVVSFVSALLAVKFLIRFVSRHSFAAFAWYRIVFGAVILVTAWTGLVKW